VSSAALAQWNTKASAALDQIVAAHAAVGGSSRGRRYATLQVNHAFAMLLSSQFQGFCRDLHSEAVDFLVASVAPASVGTVLRSMLLQGRKLDSGNPNPGNLGADFGRLGMQFWPDVNALDVRNGSRQAELEALNAWRNAIAHQDWSKVGPSLHLGTVRGWRSTCRALAKSFDQAVRRHLGTLVGHDPW
jgi:hypothetical protein